MFRNLAIAIVSACAVSIGSPAWSQNSPVEAPPLEPTSNRQSAAARSYDELRDVCRKIIGNNNNNDEYCFKDSCCGEVARRLFKSLGENPEKSTTETPDRWLRRVTSAKVGQWVACWARDDGGDPIASMIYRCRIGKY
jgi:hypothetical protein